MWLYRLIILMSLQLGNQVALAAGYDELTLYLDADQSGAKASGQAIRQGVELALQEVNHQVHGIPVRLVIKDHRGNSRRSLAHLKQFLTDEQAIAVVAGMHSPPLLAHRDFINQQQLPVLNPWAAAGPITRGDGERWIFRLSVDDSRAGGVIARSALAEGFKHPFLLLEDTGWGRSNNRTMTSALSEQAAAVAGVGWFHWGLSEDVARIQLRDIHRSGADVIFLVANAQEGKTISKALLTLPESERLPIRSHWGITGGDFAESLGPERLGALDLAFIQTSFSFFNPGAGLGEQVLQAAIRHFDGINSARDIKAPVGLVHGYDITRLFLAAMAQVELSGDIRQDRRSLRQALYQLERPVSGLIKTYHQPFSEAGPDGHEALSDGDYRMGRFNRQGDILLLPDRNPSSGH